jgi:hypothetical protein
LTIIVELKFEHVESGVKYHNPNHCCIFYTILCDKVCQVSARFGATRDQAYQLLAHVWWFSPGTPTSSTTKTGRHDIAKILLKVALNTQKMVTVTKKEITHKMVTVTKKKIENSLIDHYC